MWAYSGRLSERVIIMNKGFSHWQPLMQLVHAINESCDKIAVDTPEITTA